MEIDEINDYGERKRLPLWKWVVVDARNDMADKVMGPGRGQCITVSQSLGITT